MEDVIINKISRFAVSMDLHSDQERNFKIESFKRSVSYLALNNKNISPAPSLERYCRVSYTLANNFRFSINDHQKG